MSRRAKVPERSYPSRVLILAHAFPPEMGGVETHLWDICHHLGRRGYTVRCLVGGQESVDKYSGVLVVRSPLLRVSHLLGQRDGLKQHERNVNLRADLAAILTAQFEEFAPDIVHAHNLIHFAPELAEALCESGARYPIITSIHDRVGEHLFPEVLALPWSHTLFASEFLRDNLPACASSSVVWLGIELERFLPSGDSDPRFDEMERPVIFHPARLLRWKGVEVGVEAFLRLRERIGTGTLVLCASEFAATDQEEISTLRNEISARALNHGLERQIRFLNFTQLQMPAAYRASDVIWYPTIDEEPLGLVPLEAMACGVPLIVSDSGGMRETVVRNKTGIVVKRHDAIALADAAERILSDQPLRTALVENGLERAKLFDNHCYVDRLVKLYREAIVSGPPGRTSI